MQIKRMDTTNISKTSDIMAWYKQATKGDKIIYHSGCVVGGNNFSGEQKNASDSEKAAGVQCAIANDLSTQGKIALLQERTDQLQKYLRAGLLMTVFNFIAVKL